MNVAHISIKMDGLQRRNPHALTLTAMMRHFPTHQNVDAHGRIGALDRVEGTENRAHSDKGLVLGNGFGACNYRVQLEFSTRSHTKRGSII